jgi:basic membrane protein A and related proteins
MSRITVYMQNRWTRKFIGGLYLCMMCVIALFTIIVLVIGLRLMSVQAAPTKVGLITLPGPIDELSWNWLSYQGLLHAQTEFGIEGKVYTSTDPSEIENNVLLCVEDGNDLCIGVSFYSAVPLYDFALVYTQTKFVNIDGYYDTYPSNLRATIFASEDAAYLAGTLAALMSQSNIIGDLGGMEIPPVTAFTEGYYNGAQCANPDVTTIISYTNNFNNPDDGAEYAQGMIAQGADVIFAAAGPTGDGAILTATQSSAWAIGVDTDQYFTLFMSGTVPGSNYLLTSAMKRFDTAVFNTIADVVSETFTGGNIVYSLGEEAVGLAPFHETEPLIPIGVQTWLDWIKRAIIGGTIDPLDPGSPCLVKYQQFLPLATRD